MLVGSPAEVLALADAELQCAVRADPVACLRLDPHGCDREVCAKAAHRLLTAGAARELPVLLLGRPEWVRRLGLAGVQLRCSDPSLRETRQQLGADLVIGFGPVSRRHTGMAGAEADADFVSLGPFAGSAEEHATRELLDWWAELIKVPCLVEGGISPENVGPFLGKADFVAVDLAIWPRIARATRTSEADGRTPAVEKRRPGRGQPPLRSSTGFSQ